MTLNSAQSYLLVSDEKFSIMRQRESSKLGKKKQPPNQPTYQWENQCREDYSPSSLLLNSTRRRIHLFPVLIIASIFQPAHDTEQFLLVH